MLFNNQMIIILANNTRFKEAVFKGVLMFDKKVAISQLHAVPVHI